MNPNRLRWCSINVYLFILYLNTSTLMAVELSDAVPQAISEDLIIDPAFPFVESGKIITVEKISHRVGEWITKDKKTEKILAIKNYDNHGKLHGPLIHISINGRPYRFENFHHGKKNGPIVLLQSDGRGFLLIGNYENGKESGLFHHFSTETGMFLKSEEYNNGNLVEPGINK